MGAGAATSAQEKVSTASVEDLKAAFNELTPEQQQKLQAALNATKDSEAQIEFGFIAREWRMKYSENGLKGGAVKLDKLFKDKYLADVKKINGFVSVQRAVCGGCNDFKLVINLKKEAFDDWAKAEFAPEEAFLAEAKAIEGITGIETQPYTLESLEGSMKDDEQEKEAGAGGGDAIDFTHIAREWRMKYAENELKGGAVQLDKLVKEQFLSDIRRMDGFVSVQRVVCGGCNDFKVVIKVKKDNWEAWEKNGFAPEQSFIEAAKKISGVTGIETQPYTFEIL